MKDNNKFAVIRAIWNDPALIFNTPFKATGTRRQETARGGTYQAGAIALTTDEERRNITVHGNTNSGFAGQKMDIFTYTSQTFGCGGFKETLMYLANLYSVQMELTEDFTQKLTRERLAREVAPVLIKSLQGNPEGEASQYLTARGLQIDDHFGELTDASIKAVYKHLKEQGLRYSAEDLTALGITEERAKQGYHAVIMNKQNGIVNGFIYRNTTPNAPNADRYRASKGIDRVYCERLTTGAPAYVVEGEIDAITLLQATKDYCNAVAMGGANNADTVARILKGHGIKSVVYIPDVEFTTTGARDYEKIFRALTALQSATVNGEKVIADLRISELSTEAGEKMDVNKYAKIHTPVSLCVEINGNVTSWYDYELKRLEQWREESAEGWHVAEAFRDRFKNIYNRCGEFEREAVKRIIAEREIYKIHDVTPSALAYIDKWATERDYSNRVKALSDDLRKAVEDGANPAVIADISAKLTGIQSADVRNEWNAQINTPFGAILEAIAEQPETIKTKWEVGTLKTTKQAFPKRGEAREYSKKADIVFASGDVTIFCAPTSHGKTMFLFQAVLDCIKNTDKTFLYVSFEESQRQLAERAINAYIDIPTTKDGTHNVNPCFKRGERRKAILYAIRELTKKYADPNKKLEIDIRLFTEIERQIKQYETAIAPRLKMVKVDASAESVRDRITQFCDEQEQAGAKVGAVFVDYMQLMRTDANSYSRHDELKDICTILKKCAEVANIPVIVCAQFNRESFRTGIDQLSVANIGEGADIERIARDVFLIWQTDKTNLSIYVDNKHADDCTDDEIIIDPRNVGLRANRILAKGDISDKNKRKLKRGYMYVEQLKSRYGETGGWALYPYDGERGFIGEIDSKKMVE